MTVESPQDPQPLLRIGELSRRTGVGTDTLRAWERRYGLPRPRRSGAGYRLYDESDEERVRAMRALMSEGLSAAEAAAHVRERRPVGGRGGEAAASPDGIVARLRTSLDRFDERGASAALDDALAALSLEFVVQSVVLPALREIGDDWARGGVGVGQEHFATNLIRGRLLGLAQGWGAGVGPLAVLASPPGELHDVGLLCFGLVLRRRGWRVAMLGADSPVATVEDTARRLGADLVVLAAVARRRFDDAAEEIRALAAERAVALGGAGADASLADALGARVLPASPVEAALFCDRGARGG